MEQIVDYAMPMMVMEKALSKAHDLCLQHKYGEARELALQIATEARLLQQTLRLMEEGNHGHVPTIPQDRGAPLQRKPS